MIFSEKVSFSAAMSESFDLSDLTCVSKTYTQVLLFLGENFLFTIHTYQNSQSQSVFPLLSTQQYCSGRREVHCIGLISLEQKKKENESQPNKVYNSSILFPQKKSNQKIKVLRKDKLSCKKEIAFLLTFFLQCNAVGL